MFLPSQVRVYQTTTIVCTKDIALSTTTSQPAYVGRATIETPAANVWAEL